VVVQIGLTGVRIAIALVVALALAACGDDRYAAEREQAEMLLPGVDELRCSGEPRRAVDCRGSLKGRAVVCEFRRDEPVDGSYGGTGSCWTER
jgi:hypothetical protein